VTTEEKRIGRPPKAEADRKSRNFTFRSRGDLHARLAEAAGESGRSMSEEIERRLERSFLTPLVSLATQATEEQVRKLEEENARLFEFVERQNKQLERCLALLEHVYGPHAKGALEAVAAPAQENPEKGETQ
jgi:hypothetical protein